MDQLPPASFSRARLAGPITIYNGNGRLIVHAVIRQMTGHTGPACYFRFSEQVLFTNLALRAGIHFHNGKYNAWVIAISRSEAELDGTLQKPTMITQLGTLHSARGAMVDLSHESGPKSEAGVAVQNVERSRTSRVSGSCQKVSGSWQRLARRHRPHLSSQSGIYIRSRMSFHLVFSVVYALLTFMTKVNVYCDQRKHGDYRSNISVNHAYYSLC